MIKSKTIRLAEAKDSATILQIYTPFITDTSITFETSIPTLDEFDKRILNIQKKFPYLICEINDEIVGYAYASSFKEREAYQWTADFSIYIKPQYHGISIGKALYFCLSEILKLQGYYNAFAIVSLPNKKSERLHESIGFKPIGIFNKVGFKIGKWHDVKWYSCKINEHDDSKAPLSPVPIDNINSEELKSIFFKAQQLIKD